LLTPCFFVSCSALVCVGLCGCITH
jgi:hypothetical protein